MVSFWLSVGIICIAASVVLWTIFKSRLYFNNVPVLSVICAMVIVDVIAIFRIPQGISNDFLLFFSIFVFLNAIFIAFLVRNKGQSNFTAIKKDSSLENIIENLRSNKKSAIMEAQVRVGEIVWQDKLLRTTNEISGRLFASTVENFNTILFKCMGLMGETFGVDRVYIWQNHIINGELHCGQIHEWSGGAEPQQGNEYTTMIPFPTAWLPNLTTDKCVNSLVRDFPKYERELLSAQQIVSILVVPIFMSGDFWGFVGFDDCKNERVFTQEDEAILRSASLLFANSFVRNEMTKDLTQAEQEAKKNANVKTEFLATISHEVRTPINAITGMAKIARSSTDRTKTLECLDGIDAASRQLLSIINDILDMSKIDTGKFEIVNKPFDLKATLRNIRNIISNQVIEKSHTFNVDIDSNIPATIIGDDTRISQVLLNLLSNAVKFTSKGGIIDFTARKISDSELEFSVKDTGIGITPESQKRLFLKFEQVDNSTSRMYGGTGLGLSLCKNILDIIGGSISVDSEFGKGSTFTVKIPFKEGKIQEIRSEEGITPAAKTTLAGKNILLVEDIAINREIVIALLGEIGVNIDEAENGVVALELIKTNPSKYDAILMDIHMPLKDGYETTREIRALDIPEIRNIPIIAVTANVFDEDIKKSKDAGMNDHIGKPVNFEKLIAKLTAQLNKNNE